MIEEWVAKIRTERQVDDDVVSGEVLVEVALPVGEVSNGSSLGIPMSVQDIR